MTQDIQQLKRIVAIQCSRPLEQSNAIKLVEEFNKYGYGSELVVFYADGVAQISSSDNSSIEHADIQIPFGKDTNAKQKNFILDWTKLGGFKGMLHIIEDNAILFKDPSQYIQCVESTMTALDYSIYFSTVTDPCNYVFKKFCPRLTIDIDDDAIRQKLGLPSKLSFTSHSNTIWTIYDFNRIGGCPQKYNENFSIAMFMIIEYLARRRSLKDAGSLYYMNQYLSISDEIGTYGTIDYNDTQIDQKKMQEEDSMFKSMSIDYSPDNNIDQILESLYGKLKSKNAFTRV